MKNENRNTIQYYLTNFPDQVQDIVDEIMDNFDFDKVVSVMEKLNWKWATDEGTVEVPDVSAVRKMARKLLKNVTFKQTGKEGNFESFNACGGFEAHFFTYSLDSLEGDVDDALHNTSLTLKFVLEEYGCY